MHREMTGPGSSGNERAAALILVVSDDPADRERICRCLLRVGYTVSAAADEVAALRLLRGIAYDLVLLDGAALDGSARRILEALREQRTRIDPPAVLALVDDTEHTKTGYDGECPHGLLSKPVRIDVLAAKIEAELAHRRDRLVRGLLPVEPRHAVSREQNKPGKSDRGWAEARSVLVDALEAIGDGVVLWDPEDRLVICNESYRKLFGGHGSFVIPGARFEDLTQLQLECGALRIAANKRREWLANRLSHHRCPKGSFDDEYSDGTWVRVTENRTPAGYTVGVCTEISQIKRRETALKMSADSNRRLAAAVDATGSAILITDPDRPGNPTVFANPAFTSMTGWPVEEALGRDRSFLNGPGTDLDEVARFEGNMIAGRGSSAELLLKARNGRLFWAEVNASPMRGSDGRVVNWVVVQTDVTARRETASQVPRSRGEQHADQGALQNDCDLTGLLKLVQDNLEAALKDGRLAHAEARALLDAVLEAARPGPTATPLKRAASGRSNPASRMIDSGSAVLGFK